MAQAAKTQELISKETFVAVQSAFHSLEQAVLIHNAWTLEDLVPLKRMVCEMIRPMLKVWLDDNLPGMVERLVRTEIERRLVEPMGNAQISVPRISSIPYRSP